MKLVLLDRDGVINEDSDAYIKSPDEMHFIPGSLEAIARLNQGGFQVVVVTNQSGIARGFFDIDTLNAMHMKLHRELAAVGGRIEFIAFCPHAPEHGCQCRKPRPGLLLDIASRLNCSLAGVPLVGDSLKDLEVARAVGAIPLLVKTGKGERTAAAGRGLAGVAIYKNLEEATTDILRRF